MQELSCKKSYGSKKATLQRAKELIRKVLSSVWCKGKGEEHCAVNTDGNRSLAMADIKENRTACNKERAHRWKLACEGARLQRVEEGRLTAVTCWLATERLHRTAPATCDASTKARLTAVTA